MLFTIFCTSTGRILKSGDVPEDWVEHQQDCSGSDVLCGVMGVASRHYVDKGRLVLRPDLNVSVEGAVLTGVPLGAVITIESIDYVVQDSPVELEFGTPGDYHITIACWPFLDFETVIKVGE